MEEEGKVFLEITLPEEMFRVKSKVVTSSELGMTRISEARFENPDGSPYVLDYDMAGAVHGQNPKTGPLEGLHAGRNRIEVWKSIRR